nr:hypothetical protein [Tanacetum cinerariifolium]
MLIQAEGEGSGAPPKPQPTPYPTYPSTGDQPPVKSPHASPFLGDHPSDRAMGALNLEELFSICTNLSNRVLALEAVKDAQARLSMKKRFGKKESVSKQGRKKDKPKLTLDDSTFDGLDADHGIDYIDTEEPVNEGRLCEETEELKLTTDTEEISQDKSGGEKGGSTKELVSIARPEDSTVRPDVGTADPIAPPTTTIKPKPAKKMTGSDLDVAQIAKDAEVERLVYEEEERKEYTIKERAKFLAETIAAQRRFRSARRSAEIRSRPPTKAQPSNLMMTYMKNMGGYKHSQLKAKTFVEIQGLYEIQKRVINDFKPMDSDDAVDKEKVLEEPDSTKVQVKQEGDEESIRKRPSRRLKMKATKKSKRHGAKCIYYRLFRSDGSSRWIKTFPKMVTRFIQKQIDESGSHNESVIDLRKLLLVRTSQIPLWLIVFKKLYGSQLTMLHSKELASINKTALALAIPEQTNTGKETSNLFMAGSLPKDT